MLPPKTLPDIKSRIIEQAFLNYDVKFGKQSPHTLPRRSGGVCLCRTACFIAAAHKVDPKIRVIPQAGSASFLRLPKHLDDGKKETLTHFSYQWQNQSIDEIQSRYLSAGVLPEIHVWAAIPDTQEIIDTSTGDLANQCNKVANMDWMMPPPPRFIWVQSDEIPEGWLYEPTYEATKFAVDVMKEFILNGK